MKQKTVMVGCRCEPAFKQRVDRAAKASNMSTSEWVRGVLELELKRGGNLHGEVIYSRVTEKPLLKVAEGPKP
jgi:hypothetical protein